MTIPRNFPMGLRLTPQLNRIAKGNPLSRPIPLIAPVRGPVRWDGRAPMDNVRENIRAELEGKTLRMLLAKKFNATEGYAHQNTHQNTQLSTQSLPPDAMASPPKVETGSGSVRDAEVQKAASL